MSRIGNKHIDIPAGVEVKVEGNVISVKGPKGALDYEFNHEMKVMVDGNQIFVKRLLMTKIIVHYMVQLVH